jgi:hypothetical protein
MDVRDVPPTTDGGAGDGGLPPPSCPPEIVACGPGGVDPSMCPPGTTCAGGCCFKIVE